MSIALVPKNYHPLFSPVLYLETDEAVPQRSQYRVCPVRRGLTQQTNCKMVLFYISRNLGNVWGWILKILDKRGKNIIFTRQGLSI